ncbi:MAG: sulfite exporter TauE/SafE family protein [Treponema sp.]|jgi:uncharacterized membrane protein YfcA|nr:sulfite exporter TauE/SafE family protein [Treponema sp.]
MSTALLLSCIVVLITHTLEAVTGFGCTVLALPFVTSLLGMKTGVISLTVIAWLLALYFAITKWNEIEIKQYAIILACMLAGLPVGMYLFRTFDVANLKKVLAVFICIVSVWQLIQLFIHHPQKRNREIKQNSGGMFSARSQHQQKVRTPAFGYYVLLVVGGIVHGMFSSGGPLAVLYSSKMIPDKGHFRATMCLLWSTLNTIIIAGYIADHSFTPQNIKITAVFVPFLLIGIYLGEKIHKKINTRLFSILIFTVLFFTGIVMLYK